MPFACSICEQESTRICVLCTKDACNIHICQRCGCCSDCCECDVPLDEPLPVPVSEAAPSTPPGPDPAGFKPPEFTPPPGLETDFGALEAGADGTPPEPWSSAEAQPETPEESAAEPSETPEG